MGYTNLNHNAMAKERNVSPPWVWCLLGLFTVIGAFSSVVFIFFMIMHYAGVDF